MINLEPKHAIFDSVEQMLAPQTLTDLLSHPVTRVDIHPMNGHSGLAGGLLSFVDTDAGRLVLKRMSIASDWVMFATNDHQCRSIKLWQYGLLDQLRPHLEHKIVACARDGDNWAILMDDLTGKVFLWGQPFPSALMPTFLDALATVHATFWNDPRLQDSRLGIVNINQVLEIVPKARKYTGNSLGVIPEWIRTGWGVMRDLLAPEVYTQMVRLFENPQPLIQAVRRYPTTLLHGDFRKENLGHNGKPIFLDWQTATCSLMILDLAWFTKHGDIQDIMSMENALGYYRERLEHHLGQRFDETDWQAMVALGYAVDALNWCGFAANFYQMEENPENRAWFKNSIEIHSQRVMDALRWI
ncbi:MAG TPA: phosphotransferase [Anaerolineales bacterium]|nr:phosphotransferase [Anaerolineales bacterium]